MMGNLVEWWNEEDRGKLLGYRVHWGHRWAHLAEVVINGPGALGIRAICHGVRGMCLINTAVDVHDMAATHQWFNDTPHIQPGALLANVFKESKIDNICPKCKRAYNNRHPEGSRDD